MKSMNDTKEYIRVAKLGTNKSESTYLCIDKNLKCISTVRDGNFIQYPAIDNNELPVFKSKRDIVGIPENLSVGYVLSEHVNTKGIIRGYLILILRDVKDYKPKFVTWSVDEALKNISDTPRTLYLLNAEVRKSDKSRVIVPVGSVRFPRKVTMPTRPPSREGSNLYSVTRHFRFENNTSMRVIGNLVNPDKPTEHLGYMLLNVANNHLRPYETQRLVRQLKRGAILENVELDDSRKLIGSECSLDRLPDLLPNGDVISNDRGMLLMITHEVSRTGDEKNYLFYNYKSKRLNLLSSSELIKNIKQYNCTLINAYVGTREGNSYISAIKKEFEKIEYVPTEQH